MKIDLPILGPAEVVDVTTPKLVAGLLVDGPCGGRYEQAPDHVPDLWARIGPPGGHGVETQMWARYDRAPDGRWLYSGITLSTFELQPALAAAKEAGHDYRETYGA